MLKRLVHDPAFTLATLRGVPIRLQPSCAILPLWAAFAGYVGGSAGWRGALYMLIFVGLLYGCAALHELGHILPARKYGARVTRIRISGLGAFVQLETGVAPTPAQEFVISMGGPLASATLSVLLVLAAWPIVAGAGVQIVLQHNAAALVVVLAATNLLLTAFNLLPVLPMDGGRALNALLALRMQGSQAAVTVSTCSEVLSLAFVVAILCLTEAPLLRFAAVVTACTLFAVSMRTKRVLRAAQGRI